MMKFDEEKHAYFNDDFKEYASVSSVLNFMLGDKTSSIPKYILEKAGAKGTVIHKEIENYLTLDILGFSDEFTAFQETINKMFGVKPPAIVEQIVSNSYYELAGRFDMIIDNCIADIKTGSVLDLERITWQLSLYRYLAQSTEGLDTLNLEDTGLVFHLRGDKCEVIELDLYTEDECVEFLQDFRLGKSRVKQVTAVTELATLSPAVKDKLLIAKQTIDEAKGFIKSIENVLIAEMQERNIKQYDDGNLLITYVAPTFTTTIDSKKLKADYQDIYEACKTTSDVKASVRIKLRGEKGC